MPGVAEVAEVAVVEEEADDSNVYILGTFKIYEFFYPHRNNYTTYSIIRSLFRHINLMLLF